MPNNLSTKKRVRQDVVRNQRNRVQRSRLHTQLRKFHSAENAEEMAAQLSPSFSALDRAASKGIIHHKQASRKKSRLALQVEKAKAALCLTEPVGRYRHVVIAFISSRPSSDPLETDLVIPAEHPRFAECGLHVSSTVRLHRLMTVTESLLMRELGTLPSDLQAEATRKVGQLFGVSTAAT